MASGLLFVAGFDYLPDGAGTPYGWTGGTGCVVGSSYARVAGGKGLRLNETAFGFLGRPHVVLGASYDHVVLQFAYRPTELAQDALFLQFLTNATTTVQLEVYRDQTGNLIVKRGATTLGTTSGITMTDPDAWYYLEVRVKFDDAAGEVAIRINEEPVLTLTGQDTQDTAFADCCGFAFHNVGFAYDVDDLLFVDYSVAGAMLGNYEVRALMPSGAGTHTDFTPNTGANYAAVDEIGPDDDTTYVESSTVGHQDTYALADHGIADGTVLAVQVHHYAKKTDGATRQFQPLLRHSGSETNGATVTLGSSYARTSELFDDVPGGTGWTLAQVDALEVGQEVIA